MPFLEENMPGKHLMSWLMIDSEKDFGQND